MTSKISILLLVFLFVNHLNAQYKTKIGGGYKMGYIALQSGTSWPSIKGPLDHKNQRGFYLNDLMVDGEIFFDSSFKFGSLYHFTNNIVHEVFIEKKLGDYVLTAGKFRGAGLKSSRSAGEYTQDFIFPPEYVFQWHRSHEIFFGRDIGIQASKNFISDRLMMKLFIHNGNWGTPAPILNGIKYSGRTIDAASVDFSLDWIPAPGTVLGGHLGARGRNSWQELFGSHGWWNMFYWFKSNETVSSSIYAHLDRSNVHLFNEALIMRRNVAHIAHGNPHVGSSTYWSISSSAVVDIGRNFKPAVRYVFIDPTDGNLFDPKFHNDSYHILTGGLNWLPAPKKHPSMKIIIEYSHRVEEVKIKSIDNDEFFIQLQHRI